MSERNQKNENDLFENILKKYLELKETDKHYVLGFIQAKTMDSQPKKTA
jgi:hypothetical protein